MGSAFNELCPSANNITLLAANSTVGDTLECGAFNATITSIDNLDIASNLTFTATSALPMDGSHIICRNANLQIVEAYAINIRGKKNYQKSLHCSYQVMLESIVLRNPDLSWEETELSCQCVVDFKSVQENLAAQDKIPLRTFVPFYIACALIYTWQSVQVYCKFTSSSFFSLQPHHQPLILQMSALLSAQVFLWSGVNPLR